ncbi:hypothetical protein HK100_006153 [Physocladia obscura]|uniref:Rho-GAP domain-containing protein n=1 Tax=Physocladia obscura TaxID=109957 RepID=A0AAD5SWE6_9FUNG|nr:hypothetical protein HK100_006153 [Physocladia obscura]
MGVSELEEILHFVSVRMQTEEYYANRLQDLAALRLPPQKPSSSIISDETSNSLLAETLRTLRQEATVLSSTHRHIHDTLHRTHASLKKFLEDHRRLSQARKDVVDTAAKRYHSLSEDVKIRRQDASVKWEIARVADEQYRKNILSDVSSAAATSEGGDITASDQPGGAGELIFGELQFTIFEFNSLVADMEMHIPKQDIKSIIGTYKSVVTGASVLKYLITTGAKLRKSLQSIESAQTFFNALINQGFLKSIAIRNSNKLPLSEQQFQWKKTSLDNEPAHTKTRRDAERAEFEYKSAVKLAEEARVILEAHCIEHMKTIQVALLERLTLAKTVISSYSDSEQSCVSPITQSVERFQILLETFNPEKQVQAMAERDRTGNARLKPIVYSPSSNKIVVESRFMRTVVFGVRLETLVERDGGRKVCDLLRKSLRALVKGCVDSVAIGGRRGEMAVWLESNMYAPPVQSLRAQINGSGKKISLAALRSRNTSDIVGLIKLWLLQIPSGSLCGDEIYEPLKLLYLSKADEFAGMRSGSIRSLLTTLAPPHYNSLYALIDHLQKTVLAAEADDSKVAELSQVMGHLVLRPKIETLVTAHDKHPDRFLRDLLTHSIADIFSAGFNSANNGSNHSLQIEGEDLDPEEDNDEEEEEQGIMDEKESNDRIILLGSFGIPERAQNRLSIVSELFMPATPTSISRDSYDVKSLADSAKSAAVKSDEDIFLEQEGEGLEDLDADELSKLEAEMDQMLANE